MFDSIRNTSASPSFWLNVIVSPDVTSRRTWHGLLAGQNPAVSPTTASTLIRKSRFSLLFPGKTSSIDCDGRKEARRGDFASNHPIRLTKATEKVTVHVQVCSTGFSRKMGALHAKSEVCANRNRLWFPSLIPPKGGTTNRSHCERLP